MGWRCRRWGGLSALAVVLTACPSDDTFQCVSDDQCGASGICESNEYCSFPDEDCDTGRRYGDKAVAGISGQCVPAGEGSTSNVGSTSAAQGSGASSPGSSGSATSVGTTSEGSGATSAVDPPTTGSSSGSVDTSTGPLGTSSSASSASSTSSGNLGCEDVPSCGACFDCARESVCEDQKEACEGEVGCEAITECFQDCAVEGFCFPDCCDKAGPDAALAALALEACLEQTCANPCEGFDTPDC